MSKTANKPAQTIERKKARSRIYAIIFGQANTSTKKQMGLAVELQERRHVDPYTAQEWTDGAHAIISLFEKAAFDPRREIELIRYYHRIRPKGAAAFRYTPAADVVMQDDETEEAA